MPSQGIQSVAKHRQRRLKYVHSLHTQRNARIHTNTETPMHIYKRGHVHWSRSDSKLKQLQRTKKHNHALTGVQKHDVNICVYTFVHLHICVCMCTQVSVCLSLLDSVKSLQVSILRVCSSVGLSMCACSQAVPVQVTDSCYLMLKFWLYCCLCAFVDPWKKRPKIDSILGSCASTSMFFPANESSIASCYPSMNLNSVPLLLYSRWKPAATTLMSLWKWRRSWLDVELRRAGAVVPEKTQKIKIS